MSEESTMPQTDVKTWSHSDELKLLDAISSCGYGNWFEISNRVPPFTPLECELHYLETFSGDFTFAQNRPPALCLSNCKTSVEIRKTPCLSSLEISEMNSYLKNIDQSGTSNTFNNNIPPSSTAGPKSDSTKIYNYTLALPRIGYNRIRSEFNIEYDNGAESLLKLIGENHYKIATMENDETELFEEIAFVLCQSYNSRLKERNSLKRIVRDHCLLDRRKTFSMLQRLDVSFGRTTLKALIPLMRFLSGSEFDFLIEKLKYQTELQLKTHLFIEYRKNGLKLLSDIDNYNKLKTKRFKYDSELYSCNLPCDRELRLTSSQSTRKPTTPLLIGHLPGYNLLNEDEKKLCSSSRIVPETYNSFKQVLIMECEKHNGLRLVQARNLIKIDVNKTRKIYDYLMSNNLIWLPES